MNTNKILAEAIAKEYVPEDNSKIIALESRIIKQIPVLKGFPIVYILTTVVLLIKKLVKRAKNK